jgi:general secretion pathway protein L
VTGFFQQTVEHDESLSEKECITRTLERFFSDHNLKSDQVVVSVPGLAVSTRIITLPFTDRRKIARIISFEVEGYIPFPAEEVVISYHILQQGGGETRLLASAIRKDYLRESLETLADVGVVPGIVDLDFMALFNLSQTVLKEREGCYAIVDIGESKTSICIVDDHSLGFGRTVPVAGHMITRAIETTCSLSKEESERLKETEAFLPLATQGGMKGDEKRISGAVESAVLQIVQEIARTFYASEAERTKKVEEIFICGGTTQLTNFPAYLSDKMGIPVSPVPLSAPASGAAGQAGDVLMSHAYGLCMRAVADGQYSQFNFLKDEFAYRREIKGFRNKIVYIGVVLGVILGLLVYDGGNRYLAKKQRHTELKNEIQRVFKETFPGVKRIGSGSVLPELTSRIERLTKESQALVSLGGTPVTALDLIREVTERTPGGVAIDINTFSFDAERLRLSGRTDSFESVDRILKALQGYDLFENVTLSNAKVDVKDNKVDFKLSMSLRSS